MKPKKPYALIRFVVLCAFLLALALVYDLYFRVGWQQAELPETSTALSNPYCGWYRIYGYTLTDTPAYTASGILSGCKTDADTRLALLEINLKNYRSGPVSSAALRQLDLILSAWEQTNKNLIVRFLYDWDGRASQTEPDDLSIVLGHVSQVCPVVNRHPSVYALQGIFIGNYGEMNHSKFTTEASVSRLLGHLADVTNPSVFLAVRTPAQWRQATASSVPLSKLDAYTSALPARTGLFNDGMMGSPSDCGTYADAANPPDSSGKGTRAEELAFQNSLCRYVPNGGEVILSNAYNDFTPAIRDLREMHVSYLNSVYDPAVLNKWKASVYRGSDVFDGLNGYDYIGRHLGYRYVLRSAALQFSTFRDKAATLTIGLENVGFSSCYKKLQVSCSLKNMHTNAVQKWSVDTDTRSWLPGKTASIPVPLAIRTYPVGSYQLYLTVKDPASGAQVLLANASADPTLGYLLGSLSVNKLA